MKSIVTLVFVTSLAFVFPALADERPTAGFRLEHGETKTHLGHLDTMARSLGRAPSTDQKKIAAQIADFLAEHILEHAAWEERHLYPIVDRYSNDGEFRFTSSMRYEHTIIARAIEQLKILSQAEDFDSVSFVRATDRTLGVIDAHFEKEEELFLPILDRSMTREELEHELQH